MPEHIAFIRPAIPADLEYFNAFAQESGPGITSLPRNSDFLKSQLAQSERSFSLTIQPHQKESYLFCLEYEGRVIGSSGLISRVGVKEPFFAFHKLIEHHSSASLKIRRDLSVLHFIRAFKKPTEVGTLYLQKDFRGQGFASLLSYSRFLFIALFRKRFASTVIAELRGINHDGLSPFYEAVGRHFFGLDFSEADHLRVTNPDAIREIFPRHPIYTILLPKEAQEVIGLPHARTLPAKKMLQKQGFQQSDYLDLLDAGPHFFAPTSEIHAVRESRTVPLRELRSTLTSETRAIVANTQLDFRACVSQIEIEKGHAILPIQTGSVLNVDIGDEIIYYVMP